MELHCYFATFGTMEHCLAKRFQMLILQIAYNIANSHS